MSAVRHTLRFSLRCDAGELSLEDLKGRIERALGCVLTAGGEQYDMFLFEGYLLGMEILLGEWRGIGRARTFQLHGRTTVGEGEDPSGWQMIEINAVVSDLLSRSGAGRWRTPSEEEILAEAEYGAECDREAEAEALERE
jgi:hypothetical protein